MMKTNLSILSLGAIALAAGCASAERIPLAKGDPFADPSKFESLASNVVPTPEVVVGAPPASAPAAPVGALIDGSTLVSPAFAAVPEVGIGVDRAPASALAITTPDGAYASLVKGNDRFVVGTAKGGVADRQRALASPEKPFAVVLSCSDSHVTPERVFDQDVGNLFEVRVAGNVLGSAQVASIEYAVEKLGAKLIVVMGHESCAAVRAAIDAPEKKLHAVGGSPDLEWLAGAIRPSLKARGLASVATDDPKLRKPVMANIDAVSDNLVIRSRIVGQAVARGTLRIVRGIYSLDTGKIDFWK